MVFFCCPEMNEMSSSEITFRPKAGKRRRGDEAGNSPPATPMGHYLKLELSPKF